MTADLSGVTQVLRTWADRPAVAVALLESQLGSLPQETVQGSLTGWNRLLVGQSALLSAGQDAVEDYLQGQQEQPQDQTDSSEPSTEPEEAPDDDDQVDTPLQPPVSQDGILEMTGVGKEGDNTSAKMACISMTAPEKGWMNRSFPPEWSTLL